MSIRPVDMQTVYLRMGEVSREQDKELKKEERAQSFQKKVQRLREENFDHTVSSMRETKDDQTVKEHEERGLPVSKRHQDQDGETSRHTAFFYDPHARLPGHEQHRSAEDLALPMVRLADPESDESHEANPTQDLYDPDLGHHINIES